MTHEQIQKAQHLKKIEQMLKNVASRVGFLETGNTSFTIEASHQMLERYILRIEQMIREGHAKL